MGQLSFYFKSVLFLGRIEQNVNFRLLSYEEFANSRLFRRIRYNKLRVKELEMEATQS